jgi:hypothetical protein
MGIELLLGPGLGFLILGPKRRQQRAGSLSRTKSQFAKASCDIQSQLEANLGESPRATLCRLLPGSRRRSSGCRREPVTN